jgi:hypothetical protein
MASILKVDEMQGVTSAGDITITDGTATMQMQQGMVKAWVNYDAVDQINKGSLNQSSLTDHGQGDFSTFYTNVISSAEDKCILALAYNTINEGSSVASGAARGGAMADQAGDTGQSTTRVNFHTYYGSSSSADGGLYDYDSSYCATIGDLA